MQNEFLKKALQKANPKAVNDRLTTYNAERLRKTLVLVPTRVVMAEVKKALQIVMIFFFNKKHCE